MLDAQSSDGATLSLYTLLWRDAHGPDFWNTHNCWWWNMDAGHGPRLDMVGDVAQDDPVDEGNRQVIG